MKYSYIIIMCLFLSCYNSKKAAQQFVKAVVAYPELGTAYCAITFPVKEIFLPGDTIILIDTAKWEGSVISDTIITFDTVRITKTVTLPGKTITKTVRVTDTLRVENTAQLKVCELERGKVVDLLAVSTIKSDKWEGKAKTRFWISFALIAALLISLYFNVRKIFK